VQPHLPHLKQHSRVQLMHWQLADQQHRKAHHYKDALSVVPIHMSVLCQGVTHHSAGSYPVLWLQHSSSMFPATLSTTIRPP
jgi:hypothetical protein